MKCMRIKRDKTLKMHEEGRTKEKTKLRPGGMLTAKRGYKMENK